MADKASAGKASADRASAGKAPFLPTLLLPTLFLPTLCPPTAAAEPPPAPREISVDRNKDGQPDYWRREVGGVPQQEWGDNNYDGRPDTWVFLAPNGRRQWAVLDKNADGRPDYWFYYGAGGEGRQPQTTPGIINPLAGEMDEDFDGKPEKVFGDFPKERPSLP